MSAAAVALCLTAASPAMAEDPALQLPVPGQTPAGAVLLEIGFQGEPDGPRYYFDHAALATLPRDAFTTSTIWTEGAQDFEGVRLHRLLQALKVESGTLWLTAINGYLVELPVADLRADGALIAYARNGAPMTARDKGPLWLVFPYDSDRRWQTETVYARSIWQLVRIDIER